MAILRLANGNVCFDRVLINRKLQSLRIQLKHWDVQQPAQVAALLDKELLTEPEQVEILQFYDRYLPALINTRDYVAHDLLVLHSSGSLLRSHLQTFSHFHTHNDDEGRYVLDGECVFGLVDSEGQPLELTVQAQEFIQIPVNTEHWFNLTQLQRVKVIRFFTVLDGWSTQYTGRAITRIPTHSVEHKQPQSTASLN